MTIKQAKKILGKLAKGISDEELKKDIETAELLKNLFYYKITSLTGTTKSTSKPIPNVP